MRESCEKCGKKLKLDDGPFTGYPLICKKCRAPKETYLYSVNFDPESVFTRLRFLHLTKKIPRFHLWLIKKIIGWELILTKETTTDDKPN